MPKTTESSEFVIPPALARQAAKIAREEGRTAGALFGDMLRAYKDRRKQRKPNDEAWASRLWRQAQREERLHPMTADEAEREDQELLRYGEAQAKKRGIKEKDIPELTQKRRLARRKHARRA
jgi:hypothetical protein